MNWLKRNKIWVIIAAVGLIGIWIYCIATRQQAPDIKKELGLELEVIKARADAKKAVVEQGAATATAQIVAQHAEKLKAMDEKTKVRIAALEEDPEALAEAILRSTR